MACASGGHVQSPLTPSSSSLLSPRGRTARSSFHGSRARSRAKRARGGDIPIGALVVAAGDVIAEDWWRWQSKRRLLLHPELSALLMADAARGGVSATVALHHVGAVSLVYGRGRDDVRVADRLRASFARGRRCEWVCAVDTGGGSTAALAVRLRMACLRSLAACALRRALTWCASTFGLSRRAACRLGSRLVCS